MHFAALSTKSSVLIMITVSALFVDWQSSVRLLFVYFVFTVIVPMVIYDRSGRTLVFSFDYVCVHSVARISALCTRDHYFPWCCLLHS